jgi:hypothetical protein
MITYKASPETDKEHRHVKVYVNRKYVGYILDDKLPFPNTYDSEKRWGFLSRESKFARTLVGKTKNDLTTKIEAHYGTR